MRQLEHQHQVALFRWAKLQCAYPELDLLFAIPNGGHRNKATAGKLKAEGVKAGVPDLFLPVQRGGYAGLFIEMKAGRNKPTLEQASWHLKLSHQGYRVSVCYGWEAARDLIVAYLGGLE
jgi:hypothetical protein